MLGRVLITWCLPVVQLIGPAAAAAQPDSTTVRILGTVRDPVQRPIAGAEVRVVGVSVSVLTSDSGYFHLETRVALPLLLQVRRPGYRAQLLLITQSRIGTIVLQPGAYELPALAVTARAGKPAAYAATNKYDDYFRRRRLQVGDFISREDIERRAPTHAFQLLEGRAGIRVDYRGGEGGNADAVIAFARCNEYPPKINVYVDGHKQQPRQSVLLSAGGEGGVSRPNGISAAEMQKRREVRALVGEMLDRINPSDIELMEIYRGPGDLPPEFNDGNCGAIAIWTREGSH